MPVQVFPTVPNHIQREQPLQAPNFLVHLQREKGRLIHELIIQVHNRPLHPLIVHLSRGVGK